MTSNVMSVPTHGDGIFGTGVNVASFCWLLVVGIPETVHRFYVAVRVSRAKATAEAHHLIETHHNHKEMDK